VGALAVQLAKWKGAYVVGTESGRNQDFVRRLGADDVIDLEKMRFEEDVNDVDVVLDTIGGEIRKRSRTVLKKGGIFVSITGTLPYDEGILALGVRETFVSIKSNTAQLREIARLVDAGSLRPIIQTVLPFSEAGHAQELSQAADLRGKVVLRVA
jgi:NADPH:quinone reductase-like Zn-dependent oxidoreductase